MTINEDWLSRGTLVSLIFLTSLSFVSCAWFRKMVVEDNNAAVEEAIAQRPEFRRLDTLCREILLPEGTRFVEKARIYNSVGISYYYESEKSPKELEKYFLRYFEENGWTRIKEETASGLFAEFFKGDLEASVTFGSAGFSGDGNLAVECAFR